MKAQLILGLGLGVTLFSGCVATTGNMTGLFYTESTSPGLVTAETHATKKGTSCTTGVLGFVWGDASIEAAKTDGRISKVASVDVENTNVLYVYGKSCTVVRGE